MNESERLNRYQQRSFDDADQIDYDETFSQRIFDLLNDDRLDQYCMVDAYYYDYSTIPNSILDKFKIYRDAYLLYGITTEGEIISKWVDRWDLDCSDSIVNGKVIPNPNPKKYIQCPQIEMHFSKDLLSTPAPDLLRFFDKPRA
jgi:hypothetical protein